MDKQRLEVKLVDDRNALIRILANNGYTVRIITANNADGKKATFVEYWKEEKSR